MAGSITGTVPTESIVGNASCGCRKPKRREDKLSTTLMKKLFSLVLIAVVAFVAGCNKTETGGGAPAGTNAPAK